MQLARIPYLVCGASKLQSVLPDGCHLNLLNRVTKKLLEPAKNHVAKF